ncbi:Myelin-associated glycoprotein [Merluccius polli]|uniref:Myelin-associated glycoprotein n=1 Tax=Merluccius polli TaxID=89951 RepID=A0AA47MVD7_MERPO|nr:Myelin-associated glycoprotein [Merluccius polli]
MCQVVVGTPVELRCSAQSLCKTPPHNVTWTPTLGLSTQLQQDNVVTSTLTFNASHRHHGIKVSCTAAYFRPSDNKIVTSTIGYQLNSPRNTSALGSVRHPTREDDSVNLTCTSHANPAVSEYTWYRIHRESILKIGTGSSLSIQLFNVNNWFFCEVRNHIGTEKSNVYKIDIQTPPSILPSSGCSRMAAWVRCSCYSVGRPEPSLEWRLDGKLVFDSEDVSISQENLNNTIWRSSLTMRTLAGPAALACHSSNSAGNTHKQVLVPHLDIQGYLTDQLSWIAAIGGLAVGLLFAAVCVVSYCLHSRAWKMADQTRHCNDGTINQAPPYKEDTQVFITSGEDIYVNTGVLRNTVGSREELVGLREEPVGPRMEPVGLREEAVPGAGSPVSTRRDAADPAPGMQVADCDVLYSTVRWKKKPENMETDISARGPNTSCLADEG